MEKIGGKYYVSESELWNWLRSVAGDEPQEQTRAQHLSHDELDRRLEEERL